MFALTLWQRAEGITQHSAQIKQIADSTLVLAVDDDLGSPVAAKCTEFLLINIILLRGASRFSRKRNMSIGKLWLTSLFLIWFCSGAPTAFAQDNQSAQGWKQAEAAIKQLNAEIEAIDRSFDQIAAAGSGSSRAASSRTDQLDVFAAARA